MSKQQRRMLIESRDQFTHYAQEHRQKASRYTAEKAGCSDEIYCAELTVKINAAIEKAKVNEELSKQIQTVIALNEKDALDRVVEFADIAYQPKITAKNKQTQLGVHFEEVAEMCETLVAATADGQNLINNAEKALTALADHLKTSEPEAVIIKDRLGFIDSIADQLVTATLSAALHRMNPVGALHEVNNSNFSKLTDGVMLKDPVTAKWIKGPNYKPPVLRHFI